MRNLFGYFDKNAPRCSLAAAASIFFLCVSMFFVSCGFFDPPFTFDNPLDPDLGTNAEGVELFEPLYTDGRGIRTMGEISVSSDGTAYILNRADNSVRRVVSQDSTERAGMNFTIESVSDQPPLTVNPAGTGLYYLRSAFDYDTGTVSEAVLAYHDLDTDSADSDTILIDFSGIHPDLSEFTSSYTAISYDTSSGSVWIQISDTVYRYDPAAQNNPSSWDIGNWNFHESADTIAASTDTVWIAQSYSILAFDLTRAFQYKILWDGSSWYTDTDQYAAEPAEISCRGLACAAGTGELFALVNNSFSNPIAAFNGTDGSFLAGIGNADDFPETRSNARMAAAADGTIRVMNPESMRIFDPDTGGLVFVNPPPAENEFAFLHDACVTESGLLIIVDNELHRAVAYDPEAASYTIIGSYGTGAGELWYPTGVFSYGDILHIQDSQNRISTWTTDGVYQGEFSFSDTWDSRGLVTSAGELIIPTAPYVRRYDSSGTLVQEEMPFADTAAQIAFTREHEGVVLAAVVDSGSVSLYSVDPADITAVERMEVFQETQANIDEALSLNGGYLYMVETSLSGSLVWLGFTAGDPMHRTSSGFFVRYFIDSDEIIGEDPIGAYLLDTGNMAAYARVWTDDKGDCIYRYTP